MTDPSAVPPPRDTDEILESLEVCRSLVRDNTEEDVRVRLKLVGFEVIGNVNLAGGRISDELNQSISDYIDCSRVALMHGQNVVARMPELSVRKPEVLIAGLDGEQYEAPAKRMGNRRDLERFSVVLGIDRWILRGRVHLTSKMTVKEFLRADREFFPISRAELIDSRDPGRIERMQVAIINRPKVSFMEIAEFDPAKATSDAGNTRTATSTQPSQA